MNAPTPSRVPDLHFRIHGMDCAEEIAVLMREVAPRVGGEDRLVFNLLEGTMTVQSPPTGLSQRAVEEAVARTGMRAELLRALPGDSIREDQESYGESTWPSGRWPRRGPTRAKASLNVPPLAS
jgi:hypothetical protein